jgi:ABC-type molybdate transport system ATPase subunit
VIIIPHDGKSAKRIAIFPHDVHIFETNPPGPGVNRFKGVITSVQPTQEAVRIELKAEDKNLIARIPHHIFEDMNLAVGKEVFLILKLKGIRVYEDQGSDLD